MEWTTVLVGLTGRDDGLRIECPEADYEIAKVTHMLLYKMHK